MPPSPEFYRQERKTILLGVKFGLPSLAALLGGTELVIAASDALHGNEASDNLINAAQIAGYTAVGLTTLVLLDKVIDQVEAKVSARQQR